MGTVILRNLELPLSATYTVTRSGMAYARELGRILWFIESARRVQTRLPLCVAVAGDRNASAEARLFALGVRVVEACAPFQPL